jgi:putative iron-dependent peroxidase
VNTPQSGIFALGTTSHAYIEFDSTGGLPATELITRVASMREPRTTMGGVNLVVGFRPELWREAYPDAPVSATLMSRPSCPSEVLDQAIA